MNHFETIYKNLEKPSKDTIIGRNMEEIMSDAVLLKWVAKALVYDTVKFDQCQRLPTLLTLIQTYLKEMQAVIPLFNLEKYN